MFSEAIFSVYMILIVSIACAMYLLFKKSNAEYNELVLTLEGGFVKPAWKKSVYILCVVLGLFALIMDSTTEILQGSIQISWVLFVCSRIFFVWVLCAIITWKSFSNITWVLQSLLVTSGILGMELFVSTALKPDFRWWRVLYLTLPFNSFFMELYIWYPGISEYLNKKTTSSHATTTPALHYSILPTQPV
jgi:hypothetical protein